MTLPNFITIARLLSVPLIVWLMIADRFVAATMVFVAAGVSDAVDGFIAKRFGAASELGAYLDPVADKALLVSVFMTLGFMGVLPPWVTILVVSRDILIVGGIIMSYLLGNPMAVRPRRVSKLNTAAQILRSALVLAVRSGAALLHPFLAGAALIVAALTMLSAGAYLIGWVRHMTVGAEDPEAGGRA